MSPCRSRTSAKGGSSYKVHLAAQTLPAGKFFARSVNSWRSKKSQNQSVLEDKHLAALGLHLRGSSARPAEVVGGKLLVEQLCQLRIENHHLAALGLQGSSCKVRGVAVGVTALSVDKREDRSPCRSRTSTRGGEVLARLRAQAEY